VADRFEHPPHLPVAPFANGDLHHAFAFTWLRAFAIA